VIETAMRKRGRPKGSKSILPTIKPEDLLKRYQNGEFGTDIAKSLGVPHQAVYDYLLRHCEDEWKTAQIARAMAEWNAAKEEYAKLRKQAAEIADNIDAERVRIALACAREEAKSAGWELERLCNRLFGQKQEVNHTVSIVSALEKVSTLEAEYTEVTREDDKQLISKE
jgi:hypothetical protein